MQQNIPGSILKSQDFHHVGIIVKDIDKTIACLESLGIGPFGLGERKWVDVPFKGDLHGKPAEWKVKISSAKVGGIEIELLEPSGGESVLQEFLDEHGEGVHHIAYVSDNVKGDVETLVEKGARLLTSANLDTRGFAYVATEAGNVVTEVRFR